MATIKPAKAKRARKGDGIVKADKVRVDESRPRHTPDASEGGNPASIPGPGDPAQVSSGLVYE